MQTRERSGHFDAELRADGDTGVIAGYAALFDVPTDLGWGVREVIKPGAFTKTLAEADDVRALFNHNPDTVLGRTGAGTLKLYEDDRGLRYEISPQTTQAGQDVYESIKRGDVSQSSFAFHPVRETWRNTHGDEPDVRELIEVRLFDVSPVTYPAYAETTVVARSTPVTNAMGERRTVEEIVEEWRSKPAGSNSGDDNAEARTTQAGTPEPDSATTSQSQPAPDAEREKVRAKLARRAQARDRNRKEVS